MDMPFITHISGERTASDRSVGVRPHVLQPEACYKGSQMKEAHVLCMILNYITSVYKRSKSVHRTRSCSQKEIRKEFQFIPKTAHSPSGQLSVTGGPKAKSMDPTLP